MSSADVRGGATETPEEDMTPKNGAQDEFINDESLLFDFAERQKH